MTRSNCLALALVIGAPLAGCTQAQLAKPVPTIVVQDASTALASYQAALGLAQVALRDNPALLGRVNALAAQAAPYVAAVQTGVTDASTAPSLTALAAELLVEGAGNVLVVPR